MEFNTWHFGGIVKRLGIAMIQPREDFSGHSDGDAGGRSVAKIQTNWTLHVHGALVTARRVVYGRLVDQPLAAMRRSQSAQIRQLSTIQEGKHTRIVVKTVGHQHGSRTGRKDHRIDSFVPLTGNDRPRTREARLSCETRSSVDDRDMPP
jgi:hypothetical protein